MTIFGAILFASVIMTSCENDKSSKKKNEDQPSFSVSNDKDEDQSSFSVSNDKDEDQSNNSFSDSDCDKWLEDYEELITDYIALIKKMKANPQDMDVIMDAMPLAEKAASMQGDIPAECENDSQFISTMTRLVTKMASAAQSMY